MTSYNLLTNGKNVRTSDMTIFYLIFIAYKSIILLMENTWQPIVCRLLSIIIMSTFQMFPAISLILMKLRHWEQARDPLFEIDPCPTDCTTDTLSMQNSAWIVYVMSTCTDINKHSATQWLWDTAVFSFILKNLSNGIKFHKISAGMSTLCYIHLCAYVQNVRLPTNCM